MGYVYHMKKCGKQESELEKMLLNCSHCGKAYKSKAGLEYHLKSEHAPVSLMLELYQSDVTSLMMDLYPSYVGWMYHRLGEPRPFCLPFELALHQGLEKSDTFLFSFDTFLLEPSWLSPPGALLAGLTQ